MNSTFLKTTLLSATLAVAFAACKKDDPPTPVEQELITTVRLNITGPNGFSQSFNYKVENGFGSNPGTVQIDTLKLAANTTYAVVAQVLNEKDSPAEDVTLEVIAEKDKHMFTYMSTPSSGAGSITATNGSTDNNGLAFNQTLTFQTGGSGSGQLKVTLVHFPGVKPATQQVLGETDAEAIFPVRLQ